MPEVKQKQSKIAGFSLIELLFAMLFLSVIVFGVIRLQTSNMTLSNTKRLELKAHFHAAQALEIAEALGFSVVDSCTEQPCYLAKPGSSYQLNNNGSESLEDGFFQRQILHSEAGLTSASLVTAKVTWTDSTGEHNIEAKRVIYD